MTPFKGRLLKHRKEGTWKCHTVSRGLVQTADRQDGWEFALGTAYSTCPRNKTPVVQEGDSAGVPPEQHSKDVVVFRKDTSPSPNVTCGTGDGGGGEWEWEWTLFFKGAQD